MPEELTLLLQPRLVRHFECHVQWDPEDQRSLVEFGSGEYKATGFTIYESMEYAVRVLNPLEELYYAATGEAP